MYITLPFPTVLQNDAYLFILLGLISVTKLKCDFYDCNDQ